MEIYLDWSLKHYNSTTCWGFLKDVSCQHLDAPRLSCLSAFPKRSITVRVRGGSPFLVILVPRWQSHSCLNLSSGAFLLMFFFPSKEFTLRGKASFHFSFNLECWWSYCLLFGVKTWGLCDANDQRIVVSNNAEEADLVTTQAETTDESSTAYLGSCRQQNNQFNVQI